jgi:hypothetical protein
MEIAKWLKRTELNIDALLPIQWPTAKQGNSMRLVILSFGILLAPLSAFAQDVSEPGNQTRRITISFMASEDMIRPRVQPNVNVHQQIVLTLSSGGRITDHEEWGSVIRDNGAAIGKQRSSTSAGAPRNVVWRVLSGNRLVRILSRAQSIERIEIATSGDQCNATITEQLKPGFKEFDLTSSNGTEIQYFSRREIMSTSCTISAVK